MAAAVAPDTGSVTGDQHAAGECPERRGPIHFGSGYCALDQHICLIHQGELLRMPLETAIAVRDALTRAIDIPVRAAELAAFDRDGC